MNRIVDIGAFESQFTLTSVYVSSAYKGDPVGTQVTWSDGSTHDIGYDAFATIQSALSVVAPGGTVYIAAGTCDGTVELSDDVTFAGAGATETTINGVGDGSVITIDSGVTATLLGLTITNGNASVGGGIYNNGYLSVSHCTVTDNTASADGGGIYSEGTTLVPATLTISASTISGNTESGETASDGGAGIYVEETTLVLVNSSVSGNVASGDGGGGGVLTYGETTISGSTIDHNSTSGPGGGILLTGYGELAITNSTIANNPTTYAGGGIYCGGRLTAVNDTIAYNSATDGSGAGGGVYFAPGYGQSSLYNTIVAQNIDSGGADDIGGSGITRVSSNNLVGVDDSIGGQVANTIGHILFGAGNPGLDVLHPNGGPTDIIALLAGSPAIDAGSNSWADTYGLTTDQRGAQRGGQPDAVNAGSTVDIGAYEASSSYLVTSTADSTDIGTLRSAIQWANNSGNANPANVANAAPNTIDFDTSGAFASPQTITLSPALGTLEFSNTSSPEAINGPAAGVVTISGNLTFDSNGNQVGTAVGVFQVDFGVIATLSGLTIANGLATNGGGIDNSGTLTLTDSTVENSNASNDGGGIENSGMLTVADSTMDSNNAGNNGGGIDSSGTLTVMDSTITSANDAYGAGNDGGGIDNSGTLTVTASTIRAHRRRRRWRRHRQYGNAHGHRQHNHQQLCRQRQRHRQFRHVGGRQHDNRLQWR